MAIQIRTERYEFCHGYKPAGTGTWAFRREASHGQPEALITAPRGLTLTQAKAWVRRYLRQQGWQDATVHVAP